ncbi:hypothetical protein BS47DRAFT_1365263 [Hydnum rufescens UP504]|uniref:Uncharacterized protein n=1 Tax=Hydnum rufescens UP504 TaxID=1448309 RepID=A0A9P6APQ9_9AGAM|nr:hypothetical protein BS47DRAFT_1365263 [Hydnum rufescens UP504]
MDFGRRFPMPSPHIPHMEPQSRQHRRESYSPYCRSYANSIPHPNSKPFGDPMLRHGHNHRYGHTTYTLDNYKLPLGSPAFNLLDATPANPTVPVFASFTMAGPAPTDPTENTEDATHHETQNPDADPLTDDFIPLGEYTADGDTVMPGADEAVSGDRESYSANI